MAINPSVSTEVEKKDSSLRIRNELSDGSFTGWTYHPLSQMVISSTNNGTPPKYIVSIRYITGLDNVFDDFDLSEVSNQPTWTDDDAGLEVAKTDISSWIAEAIAGAASVILSDALTGVFIPEMIPITVYPYVLPSGTYTGVTLVVPVGAVVEFNGFLIGPGSYGFNGFGIKTSNSFTLDNHVGTPLFMTVTS